MTADGTSPPRRRDTARRTDHPRLTQRISGPAELVQAIPYLLGFHPNDSVVLVGLHDGQLVVTARLDLADAVPMLPDTLRTMVRGGTSEVIAAVYADDPRFPTTVDDRLPMRELADAVGREVARSGCEPLECLLVTRGRWWSYSCGSRRCCPPEGRPLDDAPSAFAAAATYAGVVAMPDRQALAAQLAPEPDSEREALYGVIAEAEAASVSAALEGWGERHERSVKRAIFAAARASSVPGWAPPDDATAARFAAALRVTGIRDAVWMAVDADRLDGRELWRDLARRLPSPYDAPVLFLFGWRAWRAGDGTLAGMAAERAVRSDPTYSTADLLLAALVHGLDPRRLPRLRHQRSA